MAAAPKTRPSKTRLLRLAATVNLAAVVAALLALWLLPPLFAPPPGIADPGARMAFWGRLALWPALVLFLTVGGVLVARARSVALNPIDDAESRFHRVSQRVLTNTVEQTLIFVPALAALVTQMPLPDLGFARLATALFVLGRLLFWAGYLIHPYVRAPGMAVTLTVNLVVLGWALVLAVV
ncbi:MAPEG family protein [Azospirillum argentinense]